MTMAMKNPPRRTTIKGQKHLLAYITPEEAKLLMDNGGSGEPGPMGIPSFPDYGGPEGFGGGSDKGSDGPSRSGPRGGVGGGRAKAGKVDSGRTEDRDAAVAGRERMEDFDAMVAEDVAARAGALSVSADQANREQAARMAALFPEARQYVSNVASLQNLNRQLEDLSRREAVAQSRLRSPLSLIPGVGLANYLGLQNVRNLAAASIGAPPGLLGGLGFGDRVSPDFGGLGVSDLVGLQSQAITDDMGNIVGFMDEAGNVRYGRDPNAGFDGDGRDTVPAEYNPVTGQQNQCPEGYVFDEDLQACRMGGGTPSFGQPVSGVGPYPAGDYARMGLLDVAPMGMGMFADRYGAGFGTPQDFNTANLAFRRGAATRPQYFQQAPDLTGYTLLS